MVSLDFKAFTANFFDTEKVMRAVDSADRKALNQAGRLVRAAAQRSLRYGPNTAPPGAPPTAHRSRVRTRTSRRTGATRTRSVSFLREFLFYAFEPARVSVVIGPARLNSTVDAGSLAALEYGGGSTAVSHGRKVSVRVRAHPFMRPALESVSPGLPALWRDSVT